MNWQNYEEIVKLIYQSLGRRNNVRIIGHGHNCKVKGKSGVEHQIDVLAEHSDGIHIYLTAIECKFREKPRPKDDVTKLAEIIEDAKIDKGVIVSKHGFTQDAIAFAEYKNIDLIELREPTQDDWKGLVTDIYFHSTAIIPILSDYHFEFEEEIIVTGETVDTESVFIAEPKRPEISLRSLLRLLISAVDDTVEEQKIIRKTFPSGTVIRNAFGKPQIRLKAIQFKLYFKQLNREEVIRGKDHIAMIMKILFNDKRFTIAPNGDIREIVA